MTSGIRKLTALRAEKRLDDSCPPDSAFKEEPAMLEFRLKAYRHFIQRPMPNWGPDLSGLNLDEIYLCASGGDRPDPG